jgi:hypothetical protein
VAEPSRLGLHPQESSSARSSDPPLPDRRVWWAEILLLGIIALAARLTMMDRSPQVDEFNHVLAARSLLVDGTLSIQGGEPYTRGWIYTYLVAALYIFFDDTLVVARVPALAAGVGLVLAVFIWVRAVAGRGAAWAAGLLICFSTVAVTSSQFARFYTLQALLFVCGCALIYRVVEADRWSRRDMGWVGLALVLLAVALHLQIITAVGIAGLTLWTAMVKGPWAIRRLSRSRHAVLIAGSLVVLLAVGAWMGWSSGFPARMWGLFTFAAPWAADHVDNFRFYHWALLDQYPSLWTLFPFVLLGAAIRVPKFALLCGTVFLVALVFHSFAAWKHSRYMFYAMPMFFAVSGVAIALLLSRSHAWLQGLIADRSPFTLPRHGVTAVSIGLLSGAVLFAMVGNSAFAYTVRQITGEAERLSTRGPANWDPAVPLLTDRVDRADVVVTSSELAPLYYFGRLDLTVSRTLMVMRTFEKEEFTPSAKARIPLISAPESLAKVMACNRTGVALMEHQHWRTSSGVVPEVADYLEAHAQEIPLPNGLRLNAFWWEHDGPDDSLDCSLASPNVSAR